MGQRKVEPSTDGGTRTTRANGEVIYRDKDGDIYEPGQGQAHGSALGS